MIMVAAMIKGLVGSMVMMSMTRQSMVIVVMMNLMTVIFSTSCCVTPNQRYWLLVPGG